MDLSATEGHSFPGNQAQRSAVDWANIYEASEEISDAEGFSQARRFRREAARAARRAARGQKKLQGEAVQASPESECGSPVTVMGKRYGLLDDVTARKAGAPCTSADVKLAGLTHLFETELKATAVRFRGLRSYRNSTGSVSGSSSNSNSGVTNGNRNSSRSAPRARQQVSSNCGSSRESQISATRSFCQEASPPRSCQGQRFISPEEDAQPSDFLMAQSKDRYTIAMLEEDNRDSWDTDPCLSPVSSNAEVPSPGRSHRQPKSARASSRSARGRRRAHWRAKSDETSLQSDETSLQSDETSLQSMAAAAALGGGEREPWENNLCLPQADALGRPNDGGDDKESSLLHRKRDKLSGTDMQPQFSATQGAARRETYGFEGSRDVSLPGCDASDGSLWGGVPTVSTNTHFMDKSGCGAGSNLQSQSNSHPTSPADAESSAPLTGTQDDDEFLGDSQVAAQDDDDCAEGDSGEEREALAAGFCSAPEGAPRATEVLARPQRKFLCGEADLLRFAIFNSLKAKASEA